MQQACVEAVNNETNYGTTNSTKPILHKTHKNLKVLTLAKKLKIIYLKWNKKKTHTLGAPENVDGSFERKVLKKHLHEEPTHS